MDDSSDEEDIPLSDLEADLEDYENEDDLTSDEDDEDNEDITEQEDGTSKLEDDGDLFEVEPTKKTKTKTTTTSSNLQEAQVLFSQYLEVLRAPSHTNLNLKERMTLSGTLRVESQKKCVMKTLGELIQIRGFKVNTSIVLQTFKTVDSIISTNSKGYILLILYINSKLSIQLSREIDQCIEKEKKIRQIVIVTSEGITPVAKKLLMVNKCNIQFFNHLELVVNYTQHKLVPVQNKLSDKETTEKLKKYNLTTQQLATMNRVDPIVKFYGWKVGSVIQCIKKLGLSMESYETLRIIK